MDFYDIWYADVWRQLINRKKLENIENLFRSMFVQVESLLKLCLLSPASPSSAERSFSTFRRLKTYLRSTMTQNRLNSLMLCQIHNKYASNMDIGNQIYRNKLHELNYLHSFLFHGLCYSSSGGGELRGKLDEGAGVGIKIISYTISRMAVPPADFPRVTPLLATTTCVHLVL